MSHTVCVFAGSHAGTRAAHDRAAHDLGTALAARGHTMVFGGGSVGLMGIAADAALAAGGRVIGVITRRLLDREIAHTGISELRVVASMHERKELMYRTGDAFVALPGGIGTFDELIETMTWRQLALHDKPVGLVNVDGYFDPLFALLARATTDGYLNEAQAASVHARPDAAQVLDAIETDWSTPGDPGRGSARAPAGRP